MNSVILISKCSNHWMKTSGDLDVSNVMAILTVVITSLSFVIIVVAIILS